MKMDKQDDAQSTNSKLNNDNVSFKRSISLSQNSRMGKDSKKKKVGKTPSKFDLSSVKLSETSKQDDYTANEILDL
jgi:hypothetical protein